MSSTVTTSTVSTVTAVTLLGSLGMIAILTLLFFMIKKEIVTASDHPRAQALSRVLNIAILPLMMVFSMIVVVKMATIF